MLLTMNDIFGRLKIPNCAVIVFWKKKDLAKQVVYLNKQVVTRGVKSKKVQTGEPSLLIYNTKVDKLKRIELFELKLKKDELVFTACGSFSPKEEDIKTLIERYSL